MRDVRFNVAASEGGHSGAALLIALMGGLACPATGMAAKMIFFHSGTDAPPNAQPVDDAYWDAWPGSRTVQQDENLWIGVQNVVRPESKKSVSIYLEGTNLHRFNPPVTDDAGGHDAKLVKGKKIKRQTGSGNTTARYDFHLTPQPDGEWLRLVGNATGLEEPVISKLKIITTCYDKTVNSNTRVEINSARTSDPPDDLRMTEFWFWSEASMLDTSVAPEFIGPAGSGNWTSSFVTQDPWGNALPTGGVKWATDGPGVMDGELYSTAFTCMDASTAEIGVALFNAQDETYYRHELDCAEPGGLLMLSAVSGLAILRRRRR